MTVAKSLALLPVVTAPACETAHRPPPLEDGGGVVTYAEFPPAAAPRWAWPAAPELSIGVVDGDLEYQFSGISGILPFRGGVLVADGGSGEIRAFDSAGRHVATAGGPGEGPGEFAQIRWLDVVRGDTIVAWDARTRRLTRFDEALSLIESIDLAPNELYFLSGGFDDGSLLVLPFHISPPEVRSPHLVEATSVFAIARVAEPAAFDTILAFTSRQSWAMDQGIVTVPFTQPPTVTTGPEHIWGGNGSDGSFARYDRAGTKELEVVLPAGGEVTESAVEARLASTTENAPPSMRAMFEEAYAEMPIPDRFPAFSRMIADDGGNIWVRAWLGRDDREQQWAVFDAAGAPVGSLRVPRSYTLLSIRGDRLYGVWRDELGVETVRVYRIRKE